MLELSGARTVCFTTSVNFLVEIDIENKSQCFGSKQIVLGFYSWKLEIRNCEKKMSF